MLGFKHSQETKDKIRNVLKDRCFKNEHKSKISKKLKGRNNYWVKEYSKLGLYSNKGEKHGRSKLTENDVLNIRTLFKKGIKRKELLKLYTNVSSSTIDRLIYGTKSWEDVNVK